MPLVLNTRHAASESAKDGAPLEFSAGLVNVTMRLLATGEDIGESLRDACDIISAMLPGRPAASVLIAMDGAAAAGATIGAQALVRAEVRLRSGPSLQALARKQSISVPDLTDEIRWGGYPALALRGGIRSLAAEPVVTAAGSIGALCLYSSRPHDFGPSIGQAVSLLVAHLGVVLPVRLEALHATALADQLRQSLKTRGVIDRALGILMADNRYDREQAFAILRAASQHRNMKLAAVAAELIRTTTGTIIPRLGMDAEPSSE